MSTFKTLDEDVYMTQLRWMKLEYIYMSCAGLNWRKEKTYEYI